MYWKVFKKYPFIITIKNQISYPDLQDLYTLVIMEEDWNKAIEGYRLQEKEDLERKLNK